jgi:hypothetical protein
VPFFGGSFGDLTLRGTVTQTAGAEEATGVHRGSTVVGAALRRSKVATDVTGRRWGRPSDCWKRTENKRPSYSCRVEV